MSVSTMSTVRSVFASLSFRASHVLFDALDSWLNFIDIYFISFYIFFFNFNECVFFLIQFSFFCSCEIGLIFM